MNNCSYPRNEATTNIPGPQGAAGQPAYTVTTGNFTIPNNDGVSQVDIPVANYSWMVPGMYLAIQGLTSSQIGIFRIVTFSAPNIVTVVYPPFTSNTRTGDLIPSGSGVACGGPGLTSPLGVISGGTGAFNKTGAQTNLGLGQDSVVSANTGLTQNLTTSYVRVGNSAVVLPVSGVYEVMGNVVLDFSGVTFAAQQTISVKTVDVSQGIDIAIQTYTIRPVTTTSYPNFSYPVPPTLYTNAFTNLSVELQIKISATPSAGTLQAAAGNLRALPIRR